MDVPGEDNSPRFSQGRIQDTFVYIKRKISPSKGLSCKSATSKSRQTGDRARPYCAPVQPIVCSPVRCSPVLLFSVCLLTHHPFTRSPVHPFVVHRFSCSPFVCFPSARSPVHLFACRPIPHSPVRPSSVCTPIRLFTRLPVAPAARQRFEPIADGPSRFTAASERAPPSTRGTRRRCA
jgi:hypothetical protein